jgi:hypothetical protein
VSDGGNGHWYGVTAQNYWWDAAKVAAQDLAGHLGVITSEAELTVVRSLPWQQIAATNAAAADGVWLGASKRDCAWRWVNGEPWDYAPWSPHNPNSGCLDAQLKFYVQLGSDVSLMWDDCVCPPDGQQMPALVEWSADCNGDGLVDFGQIYRGELADLNKNCVPDICETGITSVIPPSVPAQGGSTITIRGNGFPANPRVLIGGVPATNVVRVSVSQITATSPAIIPGMKSVSVNDFTLPDGIYIRPECGSDLDQNGVVDTADISIILLDFGPCYSAPLAAPATEVPPLLDAQPLPDAPRQR